MHQTLAYHRFPTQDFMIVTLIQWSVLMFRLWRRKKEEMHQQQILNHHLQTHNHHLQAHDHLRTLTHHGERRWQSNCGDYCPTIILVSRRLKLPAKANGLLHYAMYCSFCLHFHVYYKQSYLTAFYVVLPCCICTAAA